MKFTSKLLLFKEDAVVLCREKERGIFAFGEGEPTLIAESCRGGCLQSEERMLLKSWEVGVQLAPVVGRRRGGCSHVGIR